MNIRKRGMALGVVMAFAVFLAILLFGVMRLSRSEVESTGRAVAQKRAEMLAYSGINLGDMALATGRWYQPPYKSPTDLDKDGWISRGELEKTSLVDRPNFSELEFEPEGAGNGKVRVFFQEVGRKGVDVKGNRLYGRFKMQKLDLLDHIKIYAVGEFKGERVMVYGKYIMSPSPLLNAPEIELASSTDSTKTIFTITAEPCQLVKEQIDQGWKPFTMGIIKEIRQAEGQRVGPNDVLLIIEADPDDPVHGPAKDWVATQEVNPKACTSGKLSQFRNPATGDVWRVGDKLNLPCKIAEIEEDNDVGSDIPSQTLKRVAMVMRIPFEKFGHSNLAAGSVSTYQVLNQIGSYAKDIARQFVLNFANKRPFEAKVGPVFAAAFPSTGENGLKVPQETIVSTLDGIGQLDTLNYNAAGNGFIVDLLSSWRPRGFDLTSEEAENIANMAKFTLGVRECNPETTCPELFSACREFSEWKLRDPRPPADLGTNRWKVLSVLVPKYPDPADPRFPSHYPLMKVWDYFKKSLARDIREKLFPNVPPGENRSPPYLFSPANTTTPTADWINFKDFQGNYGQFGARSDGGFSSYSFSTSPEDFVRKMSFLKNAAKRFTLTYMRWIPWQDWTFQDMVNDWLNGNPEPMEVKGFHPENYWPWWSYNRQIVADRNKFSDAAAKTRYGNDTAGFYGWPDQLRDGNGNHTDPEMANPVKLVTEEDVPYTYELNFKNGTGIKTRMDYLLDYFRKYYDEPDPEPTVKKIRGASDQTDTPQIPGPPDLLGASFTGLSS